MTRRGAGEGSVYKEKATGRWRVQVTLPDGRIKRMNAPSQAAAIRKLREYRPPRAGGEATVAEYAREWLREVEQARVEADKMTAGTLVWKRFLLETYVVPALGHKRLAELRLPDVRWMLSGLAAKGLARSVIAKVRNVLGQVLDQAIAEERVDRNVARAAEMPAGIDPSAGHKRESMTVDEAKAFLEAVRGERLEALFVTALMMGLRPGELLGLRWDDVDLDARTISITGSLRTDGTIGRPKTKTSRGVLEAPGPVVEALRAHKARQAAERLKAKGSWTETGAVFASKVGTPTSHGTLRRMNRRICETAGLGRWTPHEWRHTAGSLLLDAGVDREDVARVLRHKNTRMLDDIYGHAIRPTIGGAVGPMEAIFGKEQQA
jgi:integrase